MTKKQIQFFKIEKFGETIYWATSSKDELAIVIGNPRKTGSLAQIVGYEPNTLVKVDEDEARNGTYFDEFNKKRALCSDGAYNLGKPKESEPSETSK